MTEAAVAARPSRAVAQPLLLATIIEGIGTAFLLLAVVGSGIMGERLAGRNVALALLANSLATGGALAALILAFGPYSGAHLNPAVTLAAVLTGAMRGREALLYIAAQITGAVAGVWAAHLMFDLPLLQLGRHIRSGGGQSLAEAVATSGLLAVIWGCKAQRAPATAIAVAAYIGAAYWFTSSTAFANPAVTIARALTDSFAGIRPEDVPGFILAQAVGLLLALPLIRGMERVSTARGGRAGPEE